MIRVEPLSPRKEAEYGEFLLRDPRSLLYASAEYRDFLARAVGGTATYLLALDDQDQIIGALPYFCLESPGYGTVINSLPWYGSHGGCIVSGSRAGEARRALLKQYRMAVDAPDVLSATLILAPGEEAALAEYRDILAPPIEDRRVGQMTPLPIDSCQVEAKLESVLLQKTRNLARKSLKQGFVLREVDDDGAWRFLFETHVENMEAIGGKHKPWSHFLAMRETLPANARRLLVAELDGQPVAALLLVYFNRTVEYVTPVIKHDYRSRQPLSFLIWHGMIEAIRAGYLWWNWGGTWVTQVSLHHFKAGWGAVDFPYTYLINSSPAGRSVLSANRARLGELFPFFYAYPYDKL